MARLSKTHKYDHSFSGNNVVEEDTVHVDVATYKAPEETMGTIMSARKRSEFV